MNHSAAFELKCEETEITTNLKSRSQKVFCCRSW